MFGFGLAELLIVGVILIIIVAMIGGLIVLTVSIARRRDAGADRLAK